MAKQRFRNIKQGKVQTHRHQVKSVSHMNGYASSGVKIKAFLTDAFMLLMPIMYVVFYLVMDGREDFAKHKMLGWIYILGPLVIVQTLFMYKTGQTPGYRAYKRPSLLIILFRNLAAILSLFSLVGWVVMFFRKDKKTLHDLLSATAVVKKK